MQSVELGLLAASLFWFLVSSINDRKDKTLQANQKESVCNHDCYVDYLHYLDHTDYFSDYTDYTFDYTDYLFLDYTDYVCDFVASV